MKQITDKIELRKKSIFQGEIRDSNCTKAGDKQDLFISRNIETSLGIKQRNRRRTNEEMHFVLEFLLNIKCFISVERNATSKTSAVPRLTFDVADYIIINFERKTWFSPCECIMLFFAWKNNFLRSFVCFQKVSRDIFHENTGKHLNL